MSEENELPFTFGDWVECTLNPMLRGVVVGDENFGSIYHVQLLGTAVIQKFHCVVLRRIDDQSGDAGMAGEEQENFTNVVPLKTAKMKGSA